MGNDESDSKDEDDDKIYNSHIHTLARSHMEQPPIIISHTYTSPSQQMFFFSQQQQQQHSYTTHLLLILTLTLNVSLSVCD